MDSLTSALGCSPVRLQTQPSSQASQESPFVDENENTVFALKAVSIGVDPSQPCGGKVKPVSHLKLSSQGFEGIADDQCTVSGSENIISSKGLGTSTS